MPENDYGTAARKSAKPSATSRGDLERKKQRAWPLTMSEAASSLERPKAIPVLSGSMGEGPGAVVSQQGEHRKVVE